MNTTILALQALYVAMGGALTDTYEGIAGGIPVSDYVIIPDMINAIAQKVSPSALPVVTRTNDGQVLTVSEGVWVAADPASQLPSVAATDAGQVLMVSSEGEWVADDIPAELPAVTADDNGDVLKVVDGEWAKAQA